MNREPLCFFQRDREPLCFSNPELSFPRRARHYPEPFLHVAAHASNGIDDLDISRAAAEVSGDGRLNVFVGSIWIFIQEALATRSCPGAEAALDSSAIHKGFCRGCRLPSAPPVLQSSPGSVRRVRPPGRTGVNCGAFDDHGTCPHSPLPQPSLVRCIQAPHG